MPQEFWEIKSTRSIAKKAASVHTHSIVTQVVLSIAGSDCSSGAGIQADLKTFTAHGVHGLTVVTSVVAESPHEVKSIYPVSDINFKQQLECVFDAYPIDAIKTGLFHSINQIEILCDLLKDHKLSKTNLVVDPVMIASTGDPLASQDLKDAFRSLLAPHANLITPNLPEAEALLGAAISADASLDAVALELSHQLDLDCLLKGGHGKGSECIDYLCHQNKVEKLSSERLSLPMAHGTGCSLSSAIAANLANRQSLPEAVNNAKIWLHNALKNSFYWKYHHKETYCINHSGI